MSKIHWLHISSHFRKCEQRLQNRQTVCGEREAIAL